MKKICTICGKRIFGDSLNQAFRVCKQCEEKPTHCSRELETTGTINIATTTNNEVCLARVQLDKLN